MKLQRLKEYIETGGDTLSEGHKVYSIHGSDVTELLLVKIELGIVHTKTEHGIEFCYNSKQLWINIQ